MIEIPIEIATTVVLYSFDGTCAHYCSYLFGFSLLLLRLLLVLINQLLQSRGVGPHQAIDDFTALDKNKGGHGRNIVLCRGYIGGGVVVCWWCVSHGRNSRNKQ
jgi:hypothetical protein